MIPHPRFPPADSDWGICSQTPFLSLPSTAVSSSLLPWGNRITPNQRHRKCASPLVRKNFLVSRHGQGSRRGPIPSLAAKKMFCVPLQHENTAAYSPPSFPKLLVGRKKTFLHEPLFWLFPHAPSLLPTKMKSSSPFDLDTIFPPRIPTICAFLSSEDIFFRTGT